MSSSSSLRSILKSKENSGYDGRNRDGKNQNQSNPEKQYDSSYIIEDATNELLSKLLEDKSQQSEEDKSSQQYFTKFLQSVQHNLLFAIKPKPDQQGAQNHQVQSSPDVNRVVSSNGGETNIISRSLKSILSPPITKIAPEVESKSRMRRLFSCGGWGCGRSTALRGKKSINRSNKLDARHRCS